MTTKQRRLQEVVQDFHEDVSVEDAMERLLLLAKIERGLQQTEAGQTRTHEQVCRWMINRWG